MPITKYKILTFEQRGPAGMDPPPGAEWFYYEVGGDGQVTLTGYRAGTRSDVQQSVEAIIDRLNREKLNAPPTSIASRLTFPEGGPAEDEEGNPPETDDAEPSTEGDE